MKIVIITTDSLFSCIIAKNLMVSRFVDVEGIIFLPSKKGSSTYYSTLLEVLNTGGFRFLFYKVFVQLCFYITRLLGRMMVLSNNVSLKSLATKHDINYVDIADCNGRGSIKFITDKNADILLSINVYQKISVETIQTAKVAALNVHFGLLPKFRGMSPHIWALAKNESFIGITVHQVVEKLDEGKIIQQDRIVVNANDSAFELCYRGCVAAQKTIDSALNKIKKEDFVGLEQVGRPSYYSFPTKKCIKSLRKNGFKLMKIYDLNVFIK